MIFKQFQVFNYRNIHDSGIIDVNQITCFVGQNEAGKSNLFEALYRVNPFEQNADYNIEEDWPVDNWGAKDSEAKVCEVYFELDQADIGSLSDFARKDVDIASGTEVPAVLSMPEKLTLKGTSYYSYVATFEIVESTKDFLDLDDEKFAEWVKERIPKFVYIHDYEMSGAQIELNALQQRKASVKWNDLTTDEQTILIVLDLANIDLDEFVTKGATPDGRTTRSFDKRAASAYLSKQFQDLWSQKNVRFDIDIDATTLNIFAEDEALGMPVRLNRRSTGFRWYVAFAWRFTHASKGLFKDCVLLLEEPGIHLHYSAQRDLLDVFERLKQANTILYTTHLASMVDLGFPERIRMVESTNNHATVHKGVVSNQKAPMAVIEMSLGLTGDLGGLLGNRKTLIVEGGDDALILHKLSAVLRASGKTSLLDSIYLWPARGASNTPMYAAFAIGQKWDSGVLLDSDQAGQDAKDKIQTMFLSKLAAEDAKRFRVMMIGQIAGIQKTDAAIEELFPDEFYIELVNAAYSISIKMEDLPKDGSDMITKRVDTLLKSNYGLSGLDKGRVIAEMLRRFDNWHEEKDLPKGTTTKAEKLFKTINALFDDSQEKIPATRKSSKKTP